MIAVLKRSVLDDRKRPQQFDRACCDHALVFSSSCNVRPSCLSIASRKIGKSFVAVHIDRLASGGRCDLPVKRGIHPYTAKSALIKYASGRIAAGRTVCSKLDAVWVLALQLPFPKISESMGNHDSKIVDAGSVD